MEVLVARAVYGIAPIQHVLCIVSNPKLWVFLGATYNCLQDLPKEQALVLANYGWYDRVGPSQKKKCIFNTVVQ
jgi:hypothetical protein